MPISRSLAALAALTLSAASAHAEPATAEGAKAIEQSYAAYFSRAVVENGIVSVLPDGDGYVVIWDLQKAIDLIKPPGSVKIDRLMYHLIPGRHGAWSLKGDRFPSFNFTSDTGRPNGAFDFHGFGIEGRFDPHAVEFLRSKVASDRVEGALQTADGSQLSDIKIADQGIVVDIRAKPAAGGD